MNLFQWLAGADRNILGQCSDSEKNKITGLGTLVLIPAIIGIFSMTYAVSTITDNVFMYYMAGGIWFLIVLFIDRFIVSTLYKSKLEDKANFVWAVIARYTFALFVGIAVAHPMTLLWFDGGIKEGITAELRDEKSLTDSIYFDNKISVTTKLDSLNSRKICLQQALTAEQNGIKGNFCGYETSGIVGQKGRYDTFRELIEDINRQIEHEENKIQSDINVLDNKRIEDNKSIAENKSSDYLARVRMLSQLKNGEGGSHIGWVQLFMILFFIFIDILPITMKIATPYGEYEAIRDSIIHKTVKMREADNQAINNYVSAYTIIATAKLNNEAKMGEIANLFNTVNTTTRDIEKERKKYDEIISNILKGLSVTKNEEVKKSYAAYFSSVLKMFNETVTKGQQKFLDYLRSV